VNGSWIKSEGLPFKIGANIEDEVDVSVLDATLGFLRRDTIGRIGCVEIGLANQEDGQEETRNEEEKLEFHSI